MAYRTGIVATSDDTSSVTTGTIATQSGDLALLAIQTLETQPISSVSDFYGNTWTLQEQYSAASAGYSYYLYFYTAPMITVGASETFTANWSDDGSYALFVGLFSGRNTSSPLDGTPEGFVDTSYVQSHAGASLTTSYAGSDVVAFCTDGGSNPSDTFTAGSGFTIELSALGSGSTYIPAMVQVAANQAAGSHTGTWSSANYVEGASIILALAAALPTQPFTQTQFFSNRIVTQI